MLIYLLQMILVITGFLIGYIQNQSATKARQYIKKEFSFTKDQYKWFKNV